MIEYIHSIYRYMKIIMKWINYSLIYFYFSKQYMTCVVRWNIYFKPCLIQCYRRIYVNTVKSIIHVYQNCQYTVDDVVMTYITTLFILYITCIMLLLAYQQTMATMPGKYVIVTWCSGDDEGKFSTVQSECIKNLDSKYMEENSKYLAEWRSKKKSSCGFWPVFWCKIIKFGGRYFS